MKRFILFFIVFIVFGLFSCVRSGFVPESGSLLSLQFSSDGVSKVEALTVGDALGVFARVDGRQTYALSNHKFLSNGSGILVGDPAAYYPDAEQATYLYAYYPYISSWTSTENLWHTPTDQTADADSRQADLLWGWAATTPSVEAVAVGFSHLLSRVEVEVRDESGALLPLERLTLHDIQTDGLLDLTSGRLTLELTRANIEAMGRSVLIVPAQHLSQLSFAIGSVDYSFVAATPLTLSVGVSYRLALTLRSASATPEVSLERVSITDWSAEAGSGLSEHGVRNTVTAHWLLPNPDFGSTSQVALRVTDGATGQPYTLQSVSYARDPASSGASGACTFGIEGVAGLRYPFRVDSIHFLRADGSVVQSCGTLLAQGIYRSGAVSFGIYQDNILVVTTDPITSWEEVLIPGGFDDYKYQGNTFVVKAVDPPFDWRKVHTVRFKIWNGIAEWRGLNMVVAAATGSLQTATGVFTFPDSNGYLPELRHYPIEYVELVDASGGYLYRGYCGFEVCETGQIVLWLYPDGAVQTPNNALARPVGVTVAGEVDNAKFSQNTLRFRFFNCMFDTKSARTVRATIGTTEYVWDFAPAQGANDLLFWGAVSFPDKYGSKPNNAVYHISTVELRDGKGNYLYKNYCAYDVLHAGVATIDMHQRGSVDMPSTITPPTSSNGDDMTPPSGVTFVSNTLNVRFYDPPFDRVAVNKITVTIGGVNYTWNTGVGWTGSSQNPGYGTVNLPFTASTGRPAKYPFTVTGVEVFTGTTSLKKYTLSTSVSYQGTAIIVVK